MMIFYSRQGAFSRASNEMLHLDHFEPQISFLELATKLFDLKQTEDQCFVPHLSLYGHHQGTTIAHQTTHDECRCM
jgi:hypothetical protein